MDADPNIESLKTYIQQQLQSGLQPDEIAGHLRQAGWQEAQIGQAFALVQAAVVPTPVGSGGVVPANYARRGRTKAGWLLFKQSLKVLRDHEGLTRYVVISALMSILLTIIFAVIFVFGRHALLTTVYGANGTQNVELTPGGYVVALVYYVLAFFIVNLYAAGLAANVLDLFQGNSKPYADYMRKARSRAGTLFVFSAIETTVGLILRAIAERSQLLGRIVVWIVGAVWSIARLFVVPIIVSSDDVNALSAIKQSTQLIKATWGENIIGRASFGIITFLVYFVIIIPVSILLIFVGLLIGGGAGAVVGVSLVMILLVLFVIVTTAASSVLNTAIFYYAKYKQIPPAFDADLINNVFISRKRGLFGRKKAA